MAFSSLERSGAVGVNPPSSRPLELREGWTDQRPDRLLQHASTDDENVGVGAVAAAMGAMALVGIAAFIMVVAFAF